MYVYVREHVVGIFEVQQGILEVQSSPSWLHELGLKFARHCLVSCPAPLLTCACTKEGLELFATFLGLHILKCTSQSGRRILKYHVTIKGRRQDDGMLYPYRA